MSKYQSTVEQIEAFKRTALWRDLLLLFETKEEWLLGQLADFAVVDIHAIGTLRGALDVIRNNCPQMLDSLLEAKEEEKIAAESEENEDV